MKTITYLGPRNMELQDAPEPGRPPARFVTSARRRSAARTCTDSAGQSAASRSVMGHEVVGTVDAAGDGVAADLIGRRVVVMPVVSCGS